jgi:hypothetical protein
MPQISLDIDQIIFEKIERLPNKRKYPFQILLKIILKKHW